MNESTKQHDVVGYQKSINNANNHHKKPPTPKDKKKTFKGGPMNIIKVALYMLRKKGDKSSKKLSPSFPTSATNVTLTNLVGAFRPFHLQRDVGDMSPPAPPPHNFLESHVAEVVVVPPEETSPAYNPKYAASTCSSSSGGGMSRYDSAQSLYDLDDHDDDDDHEEGMMDDGDAYYDGLEGDEMIDAKADMFIAKFYQQMRLQHLN